MTSSRQLIRSRLSSSSLGQPRMNICSCGGSSAMCSYRPASPASAAPSMAAVASGYRFGQGALYSPTTSGFS
jgi:hypothetical protein